MKRRRRQVNPQPDQPLSPLQLLTALTSIAQQGDEQRLTVLISQVEIEYPEFYATVDELINLTPTEAVARLTLRWPFLLLLFSRVPNYLTLIQMIQETIKKRRSETLCPTTPNISI